MRHWWGQPKKNDGADERLNEAESRVERLIRRVDCVATATLRRDKQNHWQESVNRLFSGGKP